MWHFSVNYYDNHRLIFSYTQTSYFTAQNEFSPANTITCACPNEVLTFNCTVVRVAITVWSGTAFTCTDHEIILAHSEFPLQALEVCGDAITANITSVENGCFISQLRVNVSTEMNNKTITCTGSGKVGETSLTVISGRY